MTEVTLMHREDGSGCVSTVVNDAGTLRCIEHGRAVWGSGQFGDHILALAGCLCHDGKCLCVVQCPAPGCGGVQHGPDGTPLPRRTGEVMTETAEAADPINPRTGRVDIVKRFRQWVDAGRPGLEVDETAVCATGIKVSEDDERYEDADENGWAECGKTSRFIVERSDFSDSYGELGGGCEACEEHVSEEMFLMLEGDDTLRAVVTPRWSTGEEPQA